MGISYEPTVKKWNVTNEKTDYRTDNPTDFPTNLISCSDTSLHSTCCYFYLSLPVPAGFFTESSETGALLGITFTLSCGC